MDRVDVCLAGTILTLPPPRFILDWLALPTRGGVLTTSASVWLPPLISDIVVDGVGMSVGTVDALLTLTAVCLIGAFADRDVLTHPHHPPFLPCLAIPSLFVDGSTACLANFRIVDTSQPFD
jgi:hypothetical protein